MPEAYRLNDYVLHGIGDPRGLIKGMYFWTWNTQEVLAMVEWMRQFNESGKGHIEFTGFDMQYPAMPLDTVRKFVIANDADYLPNLELLLQRVARISEKLAPSLQKTNQDFSQTLRGLTVEQDCRALVEHLEKDRDFYLSQASSDRDIDWVVQNARLVLQYVQLKAGTKSRDESMAENVKWIADHNPRSKIILWAHNGHVTHGAYFGSQPMGKFLAAWFGDQYLNFGFAFNEGSFRAVEPGKGLREFSVLPAPDGSLDRALANTGIPMLAIDLRQLPSIGLVREWIDVPHRTRSVGAVYSEQLSDRYFAVIRVQDAYDVLLFISETSAAKANTPLK